MAKGSQEYRADVICIRYFFLSALCLWLSIPSPAQDQQKMDSLLRILPGLEDEKKTGIYTFLAMSYSGKNPILSRAYADSAIQLAEVLELPQVKSTGLTYLGYYYFDIGELDSARIAVEEGLRIDREINHTKGIANQYSVLSHIYSRQGNYQKALEIYQEALQLEREIDNTSGISSKLHNIGIVYQTLDMYPEAVAYFLQALEVNEANGFDNKVILNLKSIGWVYMLRGDYEQALPYLHKALSTATAQHDQVNMATIYDNLGLLMFNTGKTDSARFYYENGLRIVRESGNNSLKSTLLANLSDVYREEGNLDGARSLLLESVALQQQLGDTYNLSIGYQKLAELELEKGNLSGALGYAQKAEQLAEEHQTRKPLQEAKGILAQIYQKNGNYQQALRLLREQMQIKDTLHKEEREKRFEELEIRYQAEKKEREIERLSQDKLLQEARLSRANLLRNFSVGSLLLLSVVGFLFLRQRRIRQQARERELAHQLEIEQLQASRLQEVDQMKSRFFANIAHEFRTPLTLISGPLSQLSEEVANPEKRQQFGMIMRNADRLLSLINQIMDLSRLESGLIKINEEPTELVGFVRGLTFSFQSLADQKNIRLQFDADVDKVQLLADRDKLEKVVSNLLSNAFKFTPQHGLITVKLSVDKEKGLFRLAVKDSGSGIAPEQLEKIFDRFYQADNARLQQEVGSGIGLSLSKELVELMGGTITADSLSGKGSTFSFTLPFVPADGKVPSVAAVAPQESDTADLSEQWEAPAEHEEHTDLVLIIEDNPDVRRYIRQSIAPHYRVLEAENGRKGVEIARQEVPDLIISDVMMPQMDGYEACRLIKEDEKTSHVPVILLTAKAGIEHKLEGLETGADDYLAKPFHTKELLTRTRNLIRLRQRLKQKYLSQVLEGEATKPRDKEDAFLKKIRVVVEAHLDEETFSIEDLSRELGMSRTQVYRKLKALTAKSASQFMRSIRLRHGMKLLRETDYTVSEIAYRVGFNSVSYFTKCFGEEFGSKPTEVREIKTS